MARVLEVSSSGYYAYLKRPPSKRALENEKLGVFVKAIFADSHQTYGSPRIHAELLSQGFHCSRSRVARLMKVCGIQAITYKKYRKKIKAKEMLLHKNKDLIQRNFVVSQPDKIWVADITFIQINQQWAYLAVVLDLFSRKIVGMALNDNMKTDLILQALNQALINRKPKSGLIHHSDRGSQYTSNPMQLLAQQHGISLSYGQSAYDNAVMESFFHTLKTERTDHKKYQSLQQASLDIFSYIFTFYNSKRRHSYLKYLSPNQFENNYTNNNKFVSLLTLY